MTFPLIILAYGLVPPLVARAYRRHYGRSVLVDFARRFGPGWRWWLYIAWMLWPLALVWAVVRLARRRSKARGGLG